MSPILCTKRDVAHRYQVAVRTVDRWIAKGVIPVIRISPAACDLMSHDATKHCVVFASKKLAANEASFASSHFYRPPARSFFGTTSRGSNKRKMSPRTHRRRQGCAELRTSNEDHSAGGAVPCEAPGWNTAAPQM
jgi:hypothetical protein